MRSFLPRFQRSQRSLPSSKANSDVASTLQLVSPSFWSLRYHRTSSRYHALPSSPSHRPPPRRALYPAFPHITRRHLPARICPDNSTKMQSLRFEHHYFLILPCIPTPRAICSLQSNTGWCDDYPRSRGRFEWSVWSAGNGFDQGRWDRETR